MTFLHTEESVHTFFRHSLLFHVGSEQDSLQVIPESGAWHRPFGKQVSGGAPVVRLVAQHIETAFGSGLQGA